METNNANSEQYVDALSTVYNPALTVDQTTHWFSTDEIYNAIKAINPGADLSKEQIHDAMINAGYRYQPRPGSFGLDFRWMLKAK